MSERAWVISIIPEHQNQEVYRYLRDLPETLEALGFHGISPLAVSAVRERHPITAIQKIAIREIPRRVYQWGPRRHV